MKHSATVGARGLAIGVSTVLSFGVAHAAEDDAQRAESRLEEIIVTGSLITDPNRESPSPIVISTIEDLQQSGAVALESALNQMPQFAPSGSAGNGGQGTGGHATVNLHALGANRNLVLLDGRRLPLADIFGTVDINLVPDSILSSVQTITGGASAVYGSDAMSGVVNFISLDHFEGAIFDAQYGNTEQGDRSQTKASLALGTTFAEGGGHALLSVGYTDRGNLLGKDRMPFFDLLTPSSFIGQGTFVPAATNLPNQTNVNDLFASYGAVTPVSNTLNLGFNDDGTLFTQTGAKNYKGPTTDDYRIIAGNVRMPVQKGFFVQNPLDRKSVFSKFDYELGPVTTYGQVLYVDSTVTTNTGNSLTQFGNLTTIPVTNPFIPNDLRTLLATRPQPNAPFTWNGRYVGVPFKEWDEQYTTAQYLGGLRGDLPFAGWTWDVFAAYDTTEHVQTNYNAVLKSQVQNLLNAPDGGNSICAGGFNPFGLNRSATISAACLRYMTTTAHSTEDLSQTTYQGVVQGPLFNLPAGEVKVALLADHRKNTYDYRPDSQLASQNIEAVIASQPTTGEISVDEYAVQIDVPLLADPPFRLHDLRQCRQLRGRHSLGADRQPARSWRLSARGARAEHRRVVRSSERCANRLRHAAGSDRRPVRHTLDRTHRREWRERANPVSGARNSGGDHRHVCIPDDCNGGPDSRQSGLAAGDGRYLQLRFVVEVAIIGAVTRRSVGFRRLLQHRDRGRHLRRAWPVGAEQVLQPRWLESGVRVDQPVLSVADSRRQRPAAIDPDAVSESRRTEDRGRRPAARLGRRAQ
jgi:iron complex outermembrane receptor protein